MFYFLNFKSEFKKLHQTAELLPVLYRSLELIKLIAALWERKKKRTCGETVAKHKGKNQNFHFCSQVWLKGCSEFVMSPPPSFTPSPRHISAHIAHLCCTNKLLLLILSTFPSKPEAHGLKLLFPLLYQLPALVSLSTCTSAYFPFPATNTIYFLS